MADNMLIDGLIKFCDEKSKNIKLKAEPQVFIEIKQALEELKAIKQWKAEVMEDFCRYDVSSFEELVANARNKAVDETCLKIFNHLLSEIEWNRVLVDDWDALAEEFKEIAEQLKVGGK